MKGGEQDVFFRKQSCPVKESATLYRKKREKQGRTCEDLGIPLFHSYGIDKIEIMADYFGILKSDLIEEKFEVGMTEEEQKNSDAIAVITNKLFSDKDFLSIVKVLSKLDKDQLNRAKDIISLAFPKISE